MTDTTPASIHFFISYTQSDKAWADWVAWQLEHQGHKTVIQAWDFKSGGVFPGDMHRALQQSARVIAILSPAYMASGFCQPEWQAAFADDPTGEKGVLVCVRVADFRPGGLLRAQPAPMQHRRHGDQTKTAPAQRQAAPRTAGMEEASWYLMILRGGGWWCPVARQPEHTKAQAQQPP